MKALGFMLLAISAGGWANYLQRPHVSALDLVLIVALTVTAGALAARDLP